jgi:hypothetical protein
MDVVADKALMFAKCMKKNLDLDSKVEIGD